MSGYVITIMDNPKSVAVANRCIESAKYQRLEVNHWPATTPKDNLDQLLEDNNILDTKSFESVYSKKENVIATFLSHLSLWKECIKKNEVIVVFEHDAIMTGSLPASLSFNKVITLARPSYGKFRVPNSFGSNALTQADYFKGAHGYMISPDGAKMLIDKLNIVPALPADLYFNLDYFPWLQEYYPWIVEAKDTFTTIQKVEGCVAKHNYNEKYGIINAV